MKCFELFDSRRYEMFLHDSAAEDYEKGVKEWIIEHKYFISAQWGRMFNGLFLDYGCGTGLVTRFLLQSKREVVGLDISRNMCKITKKLWGVQVVAGDCLNLPFKNDAFDVICISGVLHHFPNQLKIAFSEIGRCSKKAVCIVEPSATSPPLILRPILFLYKGYKWILNRLYRYTRGKYTYSIFERPLNPNIIIQFCIRKGFTISKVRFFNHIPFTTFLPENLRKQIICSMISPIRGTDVEIIAVKRQYV